MSVGQISIQLQRLLAFRDALGARLVQISTMPIEQMGSAHSPGPIDSALVRARLGGSKPRG